MIMFKDKSCVLCLEIFVADIKPNQKLEVGTSKFFHEIRQVNIILNSVGQHNHFITQGNYKATCFDYRLVILRPILSIVSHDAMYTLGSHRVYIYGWDPKVCTASCDTTDKTGLRMTKL